MRITDFVSDYAYVDEGLNSVGPFITDTFGEDAAQGARQYDS